ncbi:putative Ig domain-containing protein [Gallibacterium trehalosifermentans]|uniref:Alpha-galactosidase n=1 Tax=Gallibacterium trehalosifermentans TaxID=516935 RepID=A0ABV6H1K9_9PAST
MPRINGSRVIAASPSHPILFKIPACGQGKLLFSIKDLPKGLSLDSEKGVIQGKICEKGEYAFTVVVQDEIGEAQRELLAIIGQGLCLTPFMGWNSWYCHSELISEQHLRKVAEYFVQTDLINHGWTYINIDDCWQAIRQGDNPIQPNERFTDIQQMVTDIHALGLKVGIYSTPWVSTYAGFNGGSVLNDRTFGVLPMDQRLQIDQIYGRWPGLEKQGVNRIGDKWLFDIDAKQWAEWGIDFVKVDWLPNDVATTKQIYQDLQQIDRDVVISLSNNAPLENACALGQYCHAVRTTSDIQADWSLVKRNFELQLAWLPYMKPGYWLDPDMLLVGNIAKPNQQNTVFLPSPLTQAEQRTQMSFWCLLSAPLLISCDVTHLDQFTLSLLTNDDAIDINQDYPAKAPERIYQQEGIEIWRKPLHNNGVAVGIFNLSDTQQSLTLDLSTYFNAEQHILNVWQQQIQSVNDRLHLDIAAHDTVLFKTII